MSYLEACIKQLGKSLQDKRRTSLSGNQKHRCNRDNDQPVKAGAKVVAWDPMAIENARKVLPARVIFVQNLKSALENSDCAIIMTEWDELENLSARDYSTLMAAPNMVDARRL